MRAPLIWMVAAVAVAGCGPIEYMNQVAGRAASAVAAARDAHAAQYAPYEMTAAEQYLHQAREEAAYAFYQASIDFGHKSEEMAQRALAIALEKQEAVPARPGAPGSSGARPPPGGAPAGAPR